jgi:hypothetical protein
VQAAAHASRLNPSSVPVTGTDMPPAAAPSLTPPPHTRTESTLAPTAEFTRIFLLAWIIRYIFRGAAKVGFNELETGKGIVPKIINAMSIPGRWFTKTVFKNKYPLSGMENAAYSVALGLGSGVLSLSYGDAVKKDMLNMFRECVAEEKGVPQEQITFRDITESSNAIIRRTVDNYHTKMRERLGTDALFFLASPLRSEGVTDLLLGGKGVQIFADTWKRKTTLFEDLVTFVNNKINPRNGLGQPVSIGEVFDLYQHYAEAFHPDRMFNNVLGGNPTDTTRWKNSQPIFQRITDLMNQTYAYKHSSAGNDTEACAGGARFALPMLIHLLGNDYIDPDKPAETRTAIEVANAYGIPALKQMSALLAQGQSLEQVQEHFKIQLPAPVEKPRASEKNGVLPKGSTMQPENAPIAKIDSATIAHEAPKPAVQAQATGA